MTQDYTQYPTFSGAAAVAQNVTPTSITNSPGGVYLSKGFTTPHSWRNAGSRNYVVHKYGTPATYSFAVEGRNSVEQSWSTVVIQGPISLAFTAATEVATFNGASVFTFGSTVGAPAEVRFRLTSLAAGTAEYVGVDYDYTPPSITGASAHRDWQRIRVWQPRGAKPSKQVPIFVNVLNAGFLQSNPSGYVDAADAAPVDTKIVDASTNTLAGYVLGRGWVYAEAVLTGKNSNTVISGDPEDDTAVRPFGTEDDAGIDDDGLWRAETAAEYIDADNPKAQKDVRWVVQWIRAYASQLGVDPRKVILYGSSGGGTVALWSLNGNKQDITSSDPVLRQSSVPDMMIPFRSLFWFPVFADSLAANPFPSGDGTFGTTTTPADEINLSAVKYLFDTDEKRRILARMPFLIVQSLEGAPSNSYQTSIAPASSAQFALPALTTAVSAWTDGHLFWQSAVFWRMLVADLNNWANSNTGVDPLLGHFHGAVSKFRTGSATLGFSDLPANTQRYINPSDVGTSFDASALVTEYLEEMFPDPVGYNRPGISSCMSLYLS